MYEIFIYKNINLMIYWCNAKTDVMSGKGNAKAGVMLSQRQKQKQRQKPRQKA